MKSHLPLTKNNNNYFNSKIFNNNTFFLPGIDKNYFFNNFVNKSKNSNINNLFNNNIDFNNNKIDYGIYNNFNYGSYFNIKKDLFNNNIENVQKMPNYYNSRLNDSELLSNDNYNLNCINNSNIKTKFITIKDGENYKYDSINKECGLFNLDQLKKKVFGECELKIESPISFCIIVTDILNL